MSIGSSVIDLGWRTYVQAERVKLRFSQLEWDPRAQHGQLRCLDRDVVEDLVTELRDGVVPEEAMEVLCLMQDGVCFVSNAHMCVRTIVHFLTPQTPSCWCWGASTGPRR